MPNIRVKPRRTIKKAVKSKLVAPANADSLDLVMIGLAALLVVAGFWIGGGGGAAVSALAENNSGVVELDQDGEFMFQNSRGQIMSVAVDQPKNGVRGVAIISNGLGGTKDAADILAFADGMMELGYVAVRFDPTNSVGESEGNLRYALPRNYYQDLQDVANWAKHQSWYRTPLCLIGHSLGALSSMLYVINNDGRADGLVLMSAVVSGKTQAEYLYRRDLDDWTNFLEQLRYMANNSSTPGTVDWANFFIDLAQFDVLSHTNDIKVPVLMIAGEKDQLSPFGSQQMLYNRLNQPKAWYEVAGAGHVFRTKAEIAEVVEVVQNWVEDNL